MCSAAKIVLLKKNRFSGISFHFQIYFVYRESIFIGTQFNVSSFTEELFTKNYNGTDTGNTEVNGAKCSHGFKS